ncbi:MAG: hypothetical protein IPM66_01775 [Acidobacteriota bacterium]|nr:MAG: hypothetical protein IPM66_01775 [Acidobacteriota bacterium]
MKTNKVCIILLFILCVAITAGAQTQRRVIRVFLDIRETNIDKPSTVAINTLTERLNSEGFRITTNRKDAALSIEGTIVSRSAPVTDEVKKEGGVNADASASLRLVVAGEVIATSVERAGPGDWGVQLERVGEDRLIELAQLVAEDLIGEEIVKEVLNTATPAPKAQSNRTSARRAAPKKRGVSFLGMVKMVQNFVPEDRVVAAVRKYGIKFKPRESALTQLRGLGASEALISAIRGASVTS